MGLKSDTRAQANLAIGILIFLTMLVVGYGVDQVFATAAATDPVANGPMSGVYSINYTACGGIIGAVAGAIAAAWW